MKYDKVKIKPFKDRLINLQYNVLRRADNEILLYPNRLKGAITAVGEKQILFNVNLNGSEVSIKYENIKNIEKLLSRRAAKKLCSNNFK